jgi:hypothetical protein
MTKSSYARVMKKKSDKMRLKAKQELLKEYPKLMENEEERNKAFKLIDEANVAVDSKGNVQLIYQNNENKKDLINLS